MKGEIHKRIEKILAERRKKLSPTEKVMNDLLALLINKQIKSGLAVIMGKGSKVLSKTVFIPGAILKTKSGKPKRFRMRKLK